MENRAGAERRLRSREELGLVYDTIELRREQLRALDGREGILAEESLYSVLDEELIVRDFFQDRRGGFFLDVGCAWPVRSSNTYYLEHHLGWRGIGVDALEEYRSEWLAERPASRFFTFLVTDTSGSTKTFFRSPNTGLSSTDRDLASGGVFGDAFDPAEVEVMTTTLDDLLRQQGVTSIDLLSMDVEGHEAKALAGFDIERFRPELVVIERTVVEGDDSADDVLEYFEDRGYQLIQRYERYDPLNRYFAPRGSSGLAHPA